MLNAGLLALSKQFGLKYLCLVPSTLYGPGYHTDNRQMHFIFDLIRKILRGKKFGEPVILWGDGYQKRELVFVDDFTDITLRLNQKIGNDLVNIGSGEEFTIRQFAETICQHVGYDPKLVQYDVSKYVGAKSKCLDVTKLKQILPDFIPVPLQDGLRQTIDWFANSGLV
jgi:GDP-L-fucose synthase